MSKLLSTIDGSILSYANRRFSVGDSYEKCGFKKMYYTKPSYFYYNVKTCDVKSRYSIYGKHTPKEMLENNYYRVYDCGHIVYSR